MKNNKFKSKRRKRINIKLKSNKPISRKEVWKMSKKGYKNFLAIEYENICIKGRMYGLDNTCENVIVFHHLKASYDYQRYRCDKMSYECDCPRYHRDKNPSDFYPYN